MDVVVVGSFFSGLVFFALSCVTGDRLVAEIIVDGIGAVDNASEGNIFFGAKLNPTFPQDKLLPL